MSAEPAASPPPVDSATLARLASGLVHELKNPLSTIGLNLSLLEEDLKDFRGDKAPHARRTMSTLRQEVRHLQDILEDFLRFARSDRLERKALDLNQIVEEVLRFAAPECQRLGITLHPILDLDLPQLALDATRLRQVLLNLILNARQALSQAGAGGEITVMTRRQGQAVVVEVVDNGPGMDETTLAHCFEVYFSKRPGGSGLGLAIVKRLVEAHGGTVTMDSAPGKGTRVRLSFPLDAEEEDG